MSDPSEDSKQKILVVDRDRFADIISRMLAHNYDPDTANDGLIAVKKLREILPSAIVVDIDIPGNGLKLAELVGVSPSYREVPIILTSTDTSPDNFIKAQNAGANSYLAKPFGPSDLASRIQSAINGGAPAPLSSGSGKDVDNTEVFTTRVKTIDGLPAFPATHTKILELAKSEDATAEDLAEQIQLDPGLLANVFKLVNSSAYGFNKPVKELSLAVTLLGMEEIANIVMVAQVFDNMGDYEEGAGIDLKEFWKHSVGTAFIARAVSQKLQTETEHSFLGGMLHDLGKIVLDRYFSNYYGEVVQIATEQSRPIFDVEEEILGLTHAEIGGQLAQEWKFPRNHLNTILHHHTPEKTKRDQRLVCLIHIADILCRQFQFGSGGDNTVPEISEHAIKRFSLTDESLQRLTEAAEAELENADAFLATLMS